MIVNCHLKAVKKYMDIFMACWVSKSSSIVISTTQRRFSIGLELYFFLVT